jgi:hypothetical protein
MPIWPYPIIPSLENHCSEPFQKASLLSLGRIRWESTLHAWLFVYPQESATPSLRCRDQRKVSQILMTPVDDVTRLEEGTKKIRMILRN